MSAQKKSKMRLSYWLILGLPVLLLLMAMKKKNKNENEKIIYDELFRLGVDPQTIQYWIAVSKFETANFTSQVFRDANNLFGLIVPGSVRLGYGEGQTVFDTKKDSVTALFKKVLVPFKYSMKYDSADALVHAMKKNGYFTSNESDYLAGVKKYL